jgi:hypothetical protein
MQSSIICICVKHVLSSLNNWACKGERETRKWLFMQRMRGNPTEKEEKERAEGQSHEENSSVETETAKLVILG